jgi:hypothetical protein
MDGKSDAGIQQCVDDLRGIAKRLESGEKVDTSTLTNAFAKASQRMADLRHDQAQQALSSDNFIRAGYHLRSSASSLENAFVWSQQKPDQATAQLIENARQVSYNLINENVASAQGKTLSESPDPTFNTTKAEGQNIAEHARTIVKSLDKHISEFNPEMTGAQPAGARQGPMDDDKNK